MPKIQMLPLLIGTLLSGFHATATAAPGQPHIDWMPTQFDAPANHAVSWNMWWGENGTHWTLYSNGASVCSGQLSPNGNQAQSSSCQVALVPGEQTLEVDLCNSDGCKTDRKSIVVAGDAAEPETPVEDTPTEDTPVEDDTPDTTPALAPSKPTIAWLPDSAEAGALTVKWDMWWGTNGDSWALLHNGTRIHSANLTTNGQQAQSDSTVVNLDEGNHAFVIELCSGDSCTLSESRSINIGSASTPTPDPEPTPDPDPTPDPEVDPAPAPTPTDLGEFNVPYKNTSGKIVGTYFAEWGIYGRNYPVDKIPAQNLTHLLYGFIAICGDNDSALAGAQTAINAECASKADDTVTIVDRFASLEKSYPGDKWDDPIRGNFGQLTRLKAANPDITILPSIGGWTLSDPFFDIANVPARRATFVASCMDFLRQYEFFGGIDIDWEFPGGEGANPNKGSSQDRQGYADLMTELRAALDDLEQETGKEYQLTSAVGVGPSKIDNVNYVQASEAVDYFFAMTYDFYGAWNGTVGHQTALYPTADSKIEGYSADEGVRGMIDAGVPAGKIVLGTAMYGRGWTGVTDMTGGNPLTGTGHGAAKGTWEAGVLDYRDIENNYLGSTGQGINGFTYGYDEAAEAPYVFNSSTGVLITYDNQRSTRAKGQYVRDLGLAGLFSWEIDADNGRILNAMNEGLGHTPQVEVTNPIDEGTDN